MSPLRVASFSVLSCLVASPALATFPTFLPPNNLNLQDDLHRKDANMTEATFGSVIESVEKFYSDIVAAHGARLQINRRWTDSTVNANASQAGTTWLVNMYGGLARRPEVTEDGFAAVVCHELGHHLGGYYFYSGNDWASSEGQSDYFATHACLPRIWEDQVEKNATYRATVTPFVKQRCDAVWSDETRQNLCYRINAAGESLARLLAALENGRVPRFETPDPAQVPNTSTSHPAAQCRLDTYFAASLCTREFDPNVIPARNFPGGQNSAGAEELSMRSTCHSANGFLLGIRPRCWYKPTLEFRALVKGDIQVHEVEGNGNGVPEPGETVDLNVELKNGTTNPVQDVNAAIRSLTSGVQVVSGQSAYPDLAPGAGAVNAEPLALTLSPDLACGTQASVAVQASSNAGAIQFEAPFVVGRLVESRLGELTPALTIPDGSPTGITSTIESDASVPVNKVIVDVRITHTYTGDLTVRLVAPNGTTTTLWAKAGGSGDNIYKSFEVPVNLESAAGTWSLFVNDTARQDVGTLDSWGIRMVRPVCE